MPSRVARLAAVACIAAACSADTVPPTTSAVSVTTTVRVTTTDSPEVEPTTVAPSSLEPATLVFRGGPVLTMGPAADPATAVAVRGNEIVAVGTEEDIAPYVGEVTRIVELDGRPVMPGFVDAHTHYYGNQMAQGLDPGAVQSQVLAAGVTSMGEAGVDPGMLGALEALDEQGLLQVRTSLYLLHDNSCGEETGDWILEREASRAPGDRLHVGGVKVFTDGGACNAPAVSYEHGFGGNGDLYYTPEQIAAIVERYDRAGFQVAIHALGDRAVEATLDGLESVIGDSGNPFRHRIEHNAVVRPDLRDRYDEAGAVPVIFGSFGTCAYLGLDDRFRFSTPIENQEWEWPWRDLLDLNPGTTFAWHSDFPVFADSRPIASLGGFVTRYQELDDGTVCEPEPYHLKHAITVEEALHLMTMGSAYALHRDAEVGSIEVGKLADLIVLSADPTTTAERDLFGLEVELTILDGEPVHCGEEFVALCGEPAPSAEVAASASLPSNPPEYAVDGDLETHWSAGADAPQWIEIQLGAESQVTGLRLTVDQYPPGPTRHVVWGRLADGQLVQLAEITEDTDMFDVLAVTADEPWTVIAIRVETVESPSWIAWREIEIDLAG